MHEPELDDTDERGECQQMLYEALRAIEGTPETFGALDGEDDRT
jgi:hypothetical protein